MADLAKTEAPRTAVRRVSDNTTFLMPSTRDTRSPGIEVNAPITAPNQSRAAALMDILQVADKAGQQGVAYLDQKAAEKRQQDRAAGASADQLNKPDEEQLKKSRAYAQGYYLSGAHRTLIDLETSTKEAVQARLNDTSQPPATPDDIHNLINDHFSAVALNEDGTTRNFGDPLALEAMANGLGKIRDEIVPDAMATIKDQTDTKFVDNVAFAVAHGQGLKELKTGTAPASLTLSGDGVPKPGAIKSIDPNTAIGNDGSVMGYSVVTNPNKSTWDRRADGSAKGMGWLGLLQRPDGKVSSEISVGVELKGKEREIPLMVPGLSKPELDYLMTHDPSGANFQSKMPKSILKKAVAHAESRLSQGLSPFRGANDSLTSSPAEAAASPVKLTTGRLPIQGTITSTYAAHMARGSHGLDIDGYKGQPVEAPAAGKVVKSGYDERSGNYIIIDHGNGITSSYAHLSSRYFKVGQTIQAGDTLGAIGNTGHVVSSSGGDGSHLHYRVRVNGKDVDPQKFSYTGIAAPTASSGSPPGPAPVVSPITPVAYDFEAIMAQKPPSMDPKTFKTKMIDALTVHADMANRPDILEGMAMSTRKDGTPSFSPEEILKLRDTASSIRNKSYAEAQRQERELHKANEDEVLKSFGDGNDPSISDLHDMVHDNKIGAEFYYSMVNHINTEQHQDAVEAHVMAREAKQDAEKSADDLATAEAVRRQYGDTSGPTPLELFNKGQLGEGKAAFRRLQTLRSADKAGADAQSNSPEGVVGTNMIEKAFPATATFDPNDPQSIMGHGKGTDPKLKAHVYSAWKEEMSKGLKPIEAAQKVIKSFEPYKAVADESAYLKAQQSLLLSKARTP